MERDRRGHAGGAAGARGRRGAAGDGPVDGGRRGRGVRAAGQARPGPGRDAGMAPRPGRSPWAGGGCRCPGRGSGPPTGPVSCRCRRTSCSPAPSCSGGWRWSGCWPGCRPAATRSPWSRSAGKVEAGRRRRVKSAVSRKFVAMTETALADLLAADLSGLDLVAMMIDGVHFADHLCVVALGIDIDGIKHPLASGRGIDGEHHPGPGLLVGLRERGLDVTGRSWPSWTGPRPWRPAVREVFDHPVIGRCQLHKIRNVRDHLPEKLRGPVGQRMRAGLPRRLRAGGRSPAGGVGRGAGQDPPRRRRQPPRGYG